MGLGYEFGEDGSDSFALADAARRATATKNTPMPPSMLMMTANRKMIPNVAPFARDESDWPKQVAHAQAEMGIVVAVAITAAVASFCFQVERIRGNSPI